MLRLSSTQTPCTSTFKFLPSSKPSPTPPATPEPGQVNLTCSAVGDPDPEITWRSPGGHEVESSGAGYGLVDGVLTILAVTNQKDGGSWLCVACNLLGCDTADTYFGVEGQPVIRRVDASQNETTVQIACRPVGLPPPVVSYWAGGSILDDVPGHRVIGGQMLIARDWLRKAYVCLAGNEHGTDSVNLTEPLDPQLKGATPSSRSVTLTVNTLHKLSALPLEGVTVEYRLSDASEWTSRYIAVKQPRTQPQEPASAAAASAQVTTQDHVLALGFHGTGAVLAGDGWGVDGHQADGSSGDIEVRVGGLVPHSVYHVRVKLVNVLGEGPVSHTSVRVFTLPDAPPPPRDVTVTSHNRQIVVTWTVPQQLNDDKDNIYFTVRVANSSGLTVSQASVSASQPARVAVSDLDLGNHSVSIATVNSHLHRSSDDVTVLVLVTQAAPLFVPEIVSVVALSDAAIAVTWQTPTDPSSLQPPVDGYILRVESVSLSAPLAITVNSSAAASHNVSGLAERSRYNCSVAAYNVGGVGQFSDPVAVVTQYALFSSRAYTSATVLALSGEWIAVIAGCIGGAVLVLLVVCLIRKWRKLYHGSSLDLLRPSHGLDPLYLENPKGLHQTAHWSTVRWLGGFGTSRLSGTHDISTTSDNDDDDNNNNSRSCGGGESTAVPATGVGVVAMETASDQRVGKDGLGGAERLNRPWWERIRTAQPLMKIPKLTSLLPNRRNARRAKLTISHPHFSGRGATVLSPSSSTTRAAAAAAAASSSPSTSLQPQQHVSFPSRLFRPRLSSVDGMRGLGDEFPDGVSLSSVSDSLTTVSVDCEEDDVATSEPCLTSSGNAGLGEVARPGGDCPASNRATRDERCRAGLNPGVKKTNDCGGVKVTCGDSVHLTLQRPPGGPEGSSGGTAVTNTGGGRLCHSVETLNHHPETSRGDEAPTLADGGGSVCQTTQRLDHDPQTSAEDKAVAGSDGGSVYRTTTQRPDRQDDGVAHDDKAETATDSESLRRTLQRMYPDTGTGADSERVYCSVKGQDQPDLSVTSDQRAVTVTDGESVHRILRRLDDDLDKDVDGEERARDSAKEQHLEDLSPTSDDRAVTVTDGESVYHILRRLDQDLEAHTVTETQEDSVDVLSLDSSSSAELSADSSQRSLGVDQRRRCEGRSFEQLRSQSGEHGTEFTDCEDERRPEVVHRLARPSSARRWGLQVQAAPSLAQSGPCASDDASSSATTKFNAESDSYEVNPLRSPDSSSALAPTNLYAEKFTGAELKPPVPGPPVQLHSPVDDRKSSFVRRVSFSSAADDGRLEERVLEDLVDTLDCLGPVRGRRRGRPRSKFCTMQTRNSPSSPSLPGSARRKVGRPQPRFYTVQRSRSESPSVRSGISLGTIRSHDLWNPPLPARRSGVSMDASRDSTKMTWPGGTHRRGLTSSNVQSSVKHVPKELGAFLTVGRSDASKEKRLGARRASTIPQWVLKEPITHDSIPALPSLGCPRNTPADRMNVDEEEQCIRDVGGSHSSRKAAAEIQKIEDVVFGTNSVGSETADLY